MGDDGHGGGVPGDSEGLSEWRRQLAHRLTGIGVFVLPATYLVTFPVLWKSGHVALIAMDVVVVVLATYFYWWRSRHHEVVLQVMICALAYTFLISLGPNHARSAWLMVAAIIAALLSGRRAALLVAALNAAVLVLAYSVMGPEAPGWEHEYEAGFGNWAMFVVNLSGITVAAALAASHLLDRLDSALRRERGALAMLQAEHLGAVRAHAAARQEAEKRSRLEVRLREAQKLEALGRLAGGIAHDLNNMLTPVMGYAELLRKRLEEPNELREFVDEISDAGTRSRDLVRQILTFSRGVEPGVEKVDLASVIDSICDQTRPTLPTGVELVSELEASVPAVRANEIPLYQVCLNLVSNAVDALPEGGEVTISLRHCEGGRAPFDPGADLDSAQDWVVVEVQDTGTGMDAETASKVFEPFFTTKGVGKGTGLGLATLHGIVGALSGMVTLETALGKGTCFRVYLPVADETVEARDPTPTATPLAEMLRGSVLLVDDDDQGRASIRWQLEAMGLDVQDVPDAAATIDALSKQRPDILVTDLQMPGESGLALAERIRRHDTELAIVLATGYIDAATYRRAREAGIDAVIIKPFTGPELRHAIAPLLLRTAPLE